MHRLVNKVMYDVDLSKLIVMDIRGIYHFSTAENEKRTEMRRWSSALGLRVDGKSTIECDGRTLTVDKNHAVFVPHGSNCIETCQQAGEIIWLNLTVWYLDDDYIRGYLDRGHLRASVVDSTWMNATSFDITNAKELMSICERIERNFTLAKPALRAKCLRDIYDVISKIQMQSGVSGYQRSQYEIIQPAVDYIELNYSDQQLNNTRLAVVAGISEVYLRKLFSNLFGITPAKYVTDVRIEKAKSMLISGIMSVSEVAEAVGFSNIYHFSKTFKRVTGYTPTEYTKKENVL